MATIRSSIDHMDTSKKMPSQRYLASRTNILTKRKIEKAKLVPLFDYEN